MSLHYRDIIHELLSQEQLALTPDQEAALDTFYRFHADTTPCNVFILRGAAGTGKTFLIRLLTRFLTRQGYKSALLAPTGRAAKVITRRTKRYASTLHRYIYSPVESGSGSVFFQLKANKDPERMYYIIDEASMVGDGGAEGGRSVLEDLVKFAYEDGQERKIIMVGDPAQLPPVGSSLSPALDPTYLKETLGMHVYMADMTMVMRQDEASEILVWASKVRQAMEQGRAPVVERNYYGEVEVLENGQEALELYTGLYREDDPERVLFITYSNKLAVDVNNAIRKQLFDAEEDLIPGEILMVVRNNYSMGTESTKQFPFIANGEMGVVLSVERDSQEAKYGLNWVDVVIAFQDLTDNPVELHCKVVLDLLKNKDAQVAYPAMQRVIQERRKEFEHLPSTRRQAELRKDPYVNALQVKYGYAVTGHKSQGGQWKNVIVGFEPLYQGMEMADYLRWAYTAITRAEERLYVLNCPFLPKEF